MDMSDESLKTQAQTSDTIEIPQPLHARIVSLGAFVFLTVVVFVVVDMLTGTLTGALAYSSVGLEEELSALVVLGVRAASIVLFAVVVILAHLGKPLYAHKTGRILEKTLLLGVALLVMVMISLGLGILLVFLMFFWSPSQLESRDVDKARLHSLVYRGVVVGVLLGWMVLEAALSEAVIGTTLLSPVLTQPLSSILANYTASYLSFMALMIVLPFYMLMPKLIIALWKFRASVESFWLEFIHEPMGMAGLVIIGAIVLVAAFAPFIAPYAWDAGSLNLEDLFQPPSPEHILGTNQNGEDIFSRLIWGTQISLLVGLTAAIISVTIGTMVGLISGYYGGHIDSILMRITDVFLCLPVLPLMLIFLVIFGQGLQNVILVIALLGWTGTARMVRSEALSLRERPLTEAAHAIGADDTYILFRHILPNVMPLILANMILGVVNAILSEAGIAFLGFVDIHGQPSWGVILHWASKGAALLNNSWWWIIPPGLLILLTTLGFVFISHAADKVVNPRLRGRRR